MNIVNRLTLRNLQRNRRRTFVTLIGVTISVAMVTAVATLFFSFQELMKKQAIANYGSWHVRYHDVSRDQLAAIEKDEKTRDVMLTERLGYAALPESRNAYKPYAYIEAYNSRGFSNFPIVLKEGRFPRHPNEVVISNEMITKAGVAYKLGERLSLQVGEREEISDGNEIREILQQNTRLRMEDGRRLETLVRLKPESFTVVGIIDRPISEPAESPGYTMLAYVDEKTIGPADTFDASVLLTKLDRSLYGHAAALAKQLHVNKVGYNDALLRFYGVTSNSQTTATLITLCVIIVGIITAGSILLIYNAFMISVAERSRYLGLLSSIGATKRQKRNSVFFEGAIFGTICIPLGYLCGLAGMAVTFKGIHSSIHGVFGMNQDLTIAVTPLSVILTIAVSLFTILMSTYLPARRASGISAIDALRQTMDTKRKGDDVRTSGIVRYVFGIEAELGLKNLNRNKRRSRTVVISLAIGIVLFLSVSFFTANLEKSFRLSQADLNYDLQVSPSAEDSALDKEQVQAFVSLRNVTAYSLIHRYTFNSSISSSLVPTAVRNWFDNNGFPAQSGKYPYAAEVNGLSDEQLQAYAKRTGADIRSLLNPDKASAIVLNTSSFEDAASKKFVASKVLAVQKGDSLALGFDNLSNVSIAALTDIVPMGVALPWNTVTLKLIMSEAVLESLRLKDSGEGQSMNLYLDSKDPLDTQQQIENSDSHVVVNNEFQARRRQEQLMLLFYVFAYGFVALITIISVANLFNAISTSLMLRTREIAMLRSVGMTSKGIDKMIRFESMCYGLQSLAYGLPLGIALMYLIYRAFMNRFHYGFILPWTSMLCMIAAVFVIIGTAMLYASSKVKKVNIIDALKQESQ